MSAPVTYDLSLLDRSHEKWRHSPALRAFYADLFAEVGAELEPGPVLEIGSGIGVSREFLPAVVTSDIVPTAYVERAVSAYDIPQEAWTGIVAVDVLHHLEDPVRFLDSATAALRPGGRIVLAEPAATPGGRRFYQWCHHEPCHPGEIRPPYRFTAEQDGGFANMGMAWALFHRDLAATTRVLARAGLKVKKTRFRDLLAYPATGGFSRRAMLPTFLLRGIMTAEKLLPQALLRQIGLRMIVVLERADDVS
jgi:SAM-dependent methyltransferase